MVPTYSEYVCVPIDDLSSNDVTSSSSLYSTKDDSTSKEYITSDFTKNGNPTTHSNAHSHKTTELPSVDITTNPPDIKSTINNYPTTLATTETTSVHGKTLNSTSLEAP